LHLTPKNLPGLMTLATIPFQKKFRAYVGTVIFNSRVKYEDRDFSHFGAIII